MSLFSNILNILTGNKFFAGIIAIDDSISIEGPAITDEEKYKLIAENTYEWEYLVDCNGNLIYCSPSCNRVTGYTNNEFINDPGLFHKIVYPEDKHLFVDYLNCKQIKSVEKQLEFRIIKKTGEICWIGHVCMNVYAESGEIIGRRSSNRDITAYKEALDKLSESEERYKQAFLTSPDAVNINKLDGTFVDINEGFTSIMGYSREDVIGISSLKINVWAIPEHRDILMKELKEKGKINNIESVFRKKDGATTTGLMSASIITLNNEPHILYITHDIGKRKKLEQELYVKSQKIQESEQKFKNFFHYAVIGKAILNLKGQFTEVNTALCQMMGYTADELKEKTFSDITYPDDIKIGNDLVKDIISGKREFFILEKRYLKKNGDTIWALVSATTVKNEKGEAQNLIAQVQDITERKKTEITLRKLSRAVEQSPTSIVITDKKGTIEYVNPKCVEITGYSENELIGNNPRVLKTNHTTLAEYQKMWSELTSGNIWKGEFCNKKKDGDIYWESAIISPIVNEKEEITGYIAVKEDITHKKQTDEDLIDAYKELEKAQRVARLGSWSWNIENGKLTWSDEMYRIFGIDKNFFTGNLIDVIANAIHPDDREAVNYSNNSVITKQKPIPLEYRVIWPDGSTHTIWAEAGELSLDKDGKSYILRGIAQDITDRKNIELAILKSEEKLKKLLDSVTDYSYTVEVDASMPVRTSHGTGCIAVTGYTPKEYEANVFLWFNIIYDDDKPAVMEHINMLHHGLSVYPIEHRILHKDGSIRWVRNTSVPRFNNNGEFIAYDGLISDITERKLFEEALIESEQRFKYLSGVTLDGIGFAENGIIIDCNEQLLKLYEVTADDFFGKPIIDLVAPDYREIVMSNIKSNNPNTYEFTALKHDGSTFYAEMQSNTINMRGKQIAVAIIRNITERKESGRKMLSAMIEAEERERDRISHELHDGLGPLLSTIKVYFQWLNEDADKIIKDDLIKKGGRNIEEAINLIREISHNLSSRILINFGLVAALRNQIEDISNKGKIEFSFYSNTEERFDRNIEFSLYRITNELINNTLKHANAKQVVVNLVLNNEKKLLLFNYFDNGKGFDRAKISQNTKGLGLMNMIQRVSNLGGTIHIDTSVGKGLQIHIELPVV
jgi:PAS domain S-box-containing protein